LCSVVKLILQNLDEQMSYDNKTNTGGHGENNIRRVLSKVIERSGAVNECKECGRFSDKKNPHRPQDTKNLYG